MNNAGFMEKLLDGVEVEWKALGEVAKYSKTRIDFNLVNKENYVGVDNLLQNRAGKTDSSYVPTEGRLIEYRAGDVLIGNIRPYLKKIWHANCAGGTNGDVLVIHPTHEALNSGYLYQVLTDDKFFAYNMQHAKGAKMPRGDKTKILEYNIPIPCPENPEKSLEIQAEIVRILDAFTALTAELTAELTARKKQYNYYRDQLLSFEEGEVKWKTLGSVSTKVSSGGTPLSTRLEFYDGDIPWLRTQEVCFNEIFITDIKITELAVKESSAKWIPANCVIVAISGATAARSAINKIPLTTNQHCCNLEINPAIANYRYVFHWVCREHDKLKAFGQGARGDLNAGIIKDYPIPIPYADTPEQSLTEQARIVAILDKFDALTNSITEGLPREIALRQQQYAYYRDLLLSFPKPAPEMPLESVE